MKYYNKVFYVICGMFTAVINASLIAKCPPPALNREELLCAMHSTIAKELKITEAEAQEKMIEWFIKYSPSDMAWYVFWKGYNKKLPPKIADRLTKKELADFLAEEKKRLEGEGLLKKKDKPRKSQQKKIETKKAPAVSERKERKKSSRKKPTR